MKNIKTILALALTMVISTAFAQDKASAAVAEMKDGKTTVFEVAKLSATGTPEQSTHTVKYPASFTVFEQNEIKAGVENGQIKIGIVAVPAAMTQGQIEQMIENPSMGGLIAGQMGGELIESVNVNLPSGEKALKMAMKIPKGEDFIIVIMYMVVVGEDAVTLQAAIEADPTQIDGLYQGYAPVVNAVFNSYAKK